jgi:predicted metal-dependent hydrolase
MLHLKIADNVHVQVKKHRQAKRFKITVKQNGEISATLPFLMPYCIGKSLVYQHKPWILKQVKKINFKPLNNFNEKEGRQKAKIIIPELVNYYTALYKTNYNKITLKNIKTRWGSCSTKRNLNFNWRIILAPEKVLQYVIIHEVCHLVEMNHSRNFWQLVSQACPDYKTQRTWLRKNGYTLY